MIKLRKNLILLSTACSAYFLSSTVQAAFLAVIYTPNMENKGDYTAKSALIKNQMVKYDNWDAENITIVGADKTMTQAMAVVQGTAVAANDTFVFMSITHGGKGGVAGGNGDDIEQFSIDDASTALDDDDESLGTWKNDTGWTITNDDLVADAFETLNSDATKLAIINSCYAGGLWGEDAFDLGPNNVDNMGLFASSKEDQKTAANVPFFTKLTDGITTTTAGVAGPADANADGSITIGEWYNYSKSPITQYFGASLEIGDDSTDPFYSETEFLSSSSSLEFQTLFVSNLSSVPIPSAIWLFCSGLIGLVGVARKQGMDTSKPNLYSSLKKKT